MNWFSHLRDRVTGAQADAPPAFDAPLLPDERLAVVGDVHGSYDLLMELLGQLGTVDPPPGRLVFVGDLVDRGERSGDVLTLLFDTQKRLGDRMVVLRGNHEDMMLGFIDDPVGGTRWLRYGGLQTLASLGVGDVTDRPSEAAAERARDALVATLGRERIAWLRASPTRYTNGNVTVVHAGADPALPLDRQSPRDLTWGHPDFFSVPRRDGRWVVHGHTVVDEVAADQGRIGVDTGAYATGVLSAAIIDKGHLSAVSASG